MFSLLSWQWDESQRNLKTFFGRFKWVGRWMLPCLMPTRKWPDWIWPQDQTNEKTEDQKKCWQRQKFRTRLARWCLQSFSPTRRHPTLRRRQRRVWRRRPEEERWPTDLRGSTAATTCWWRRSWQRRTRQTCGATRGLPKSSIFLLKIYLPRLISSWEWESLQKIFRWIQTLGWDLRVMDFLPSAENR